MNRATEVQRKRVSQYLQEWLGRLIEAETLAVSGLYDAGWNVVRNIAQRANRNRWSVYLVGGALRDLAFSRGARTPRDFDLVFCNVNQDDLAAEFRDLSEARRTSLGGLRFRQRDVLIDIWSLQETLAVRDKAKARIQDVPRHAFLDVEAIAIELSPGIGKSRRVVENGFTKAFLRNTLDVNHADNPFPEVCFVKSIRTAIALQLSVGHGLVEYVLSRRWNLDALVEAQRSHYGDVVFDKPELEGILELFANWDKKSGELHLASLMLKRKELYDVVNNVQKSKRAIDADKIS
jgi:hypothetical protein